MIRILLAEDDESLNKIVTMYLKRNGYEVTSCFNGKEALLQLSYSSFDMVLTDIMMPEMDGYSLAMEIRSVNEKLPIVFMTAKDDIFSKQKGYRIGIDDYIVKPFDLDELIMKIGAILRRASIVTSKKLEVGNLTMDEEEHSCLVDGEELNLTVREFNILFKMLSTPKKTFTRAQLMEEFWDFDSSTTSRTVDVYMVKLREKTKDCTGFEIATVHGLGYKVILKQ